MKMDDFEVVVFDYEGTLSMSPACHVSFEGTLGQFDFAELKPNDMIFESRNLLKRKRVFVVGMIRCNVEIEQKFRWLKKYFTFIKHEDCYFITSTHKKSEVVSFLMKKYNFDKNKILFVDDRDNHLQDVSQLGVNCMSPVEYHNFCEK